MLAIAFKSSPTGVVSAYVHIDGKDHGPVEAVGMVRELGQALIEAGRDKAPKIVTLGHYGFPDTPPHRVA